MNKTIKHIVFTLVAFAPFAAVASAESYTLTIADAKRVAVERNADLAAAKARVESAEAREDRSSSVYYPQISTKLGTEQQLSGPGDRGDANAAFGYLSATWNIYRGGIDSAKAKAEALAKLRATIDYDIKKMEVENAVERVFYRMLFLRDIKKIKTNFIGINRQQQTLARQIVARGAASKSDVVEFDLRTATLESDLVGIEQQYQTYQIELKALLGEDIAKNPQPSGELPHQHLDAALGDYANDQLKDAPEIKQATVALDIAGHRSAAAKGRWLPQLDFEANFGALPPSQDGVKGELRSNLALIATWEIFGRFDATHEAREMAAERRAADAELKGSITRILADVEAAFIELQSIQNPSDIEKNNIATAKNYYDLVYQDFGRGYRNSGDFSAAAEIWYNAEVRRKELDMEFIDKKLLLETKIGRKISATAMVDEEKGPAKSK